MGYIRESNKGEFLYYIYEMKDYSISEAVRWLKQLFDNRLISANIITLRDSDRSLDEGNKSWQSKIPFDEKIIENEIQRRSINKISIDGIFQSVEVSISYNLKNNTVSIGFDADSKIDRDIVEKKLMLS